MDHWVSSGIQMEYLIYYSNRFNPRFPMVLSCLVWEDMALEYPKITIYPKIYPLHGSLTGSHIVCYNICQCHTLY